MSRRTENRPTVPVSNARSSHAPDIAEENLSSEGRRILLVAPEPFFTDRGTPIALRHVIKALSEIGYEIDIATYPLGRDLDIPNVNVFRTNNPLHFRTIPVGFSFKKLALDLLLFRLVLKLLRRRQYFCIHAVEEAAFIASFVRRKYRFNFVYDMQSSLPEHLATKLFFRIGPVQRICQALEKRLLVRADAVFCSAGLATHVSSVAPGVRAWDWIFPADYRYAGSDEVVELRNELQIPDDRKVIVYSGTFAPYQGLPILIKAIPRVVAANPDAVFVLVGAERQTDIDALEKLLEPGLETHVRLLHRVQKNLIPRFLALADILVSTRIQSGNLPIKIFEYLANGKPIVATDISAHRSVLNEERAVLVAPTPEAFADALTALLGNPGRMAELAESSKKYARNNLSWNGFVTSVENVYPRLQH